MSGARAAQGPATVGATGPARPRFRLPDLSPGMRAAGMANLGPYSNAGLRGGLREGAQELLSSGDEVTPEIALEKVRWLANLLGYDNQSPADLQKLIQMIEGQQQP